MTITRSVKLITALIAAGCLAGTQASAATVDFTFWNASGDSVVLDNGLEVTLETERVQRFGTGVRDLVGQEGVFTFSFSQSITDFTINLGRVRNDETVFNFNIAPSSVTGDLVSEGAPISLVSTDDLGDFNTGSIVWSNIATNVLSFTFGNVTTPNNSAIALLSFDGVIAQSAIPVPAGVVLFPAGLAAFAAFKRKQKAS
ncbi:MAG: hypothetical protein AAF788_01390 [Pseudomonadota bacterium]